jgi:hypothetical protein
MIHLGFCLHDGDFVNALISLGRVLFPRHGSTKHCVERKENPHVVL